MCGRHTRLFCQHKMGTFQVMSATLPPLTPAEVQGNPKGKGGVSQVIYEGVAMSVPLISQKHLPF